MQGLIKTLRKNLNSSDELGVCLFVFFFRVDQIHRYGGNKNLKAQNPERKINRKIRLTLNFMISCGVQLHDVNAPALLQLRESSEPTHLLTFIVKNKINKMNTQNTEVRGTDQE